MSDQERWRVACHESGHAVIAVVLGGESLGIVLTVNGGLSMSQGLFNDNYMIMVASGDFAAQLADDYQAPDEPFVDCYEVASSPTKCESKDFASICNFVDLPELQQRCESDSRKLALWSISGCEDSPESWPIRVRRIKRVAAEYVERHREAIVRVAERLYVDGKLTGEQIQELYQEGTA